MTADLKGRPGAYLLVVALDRPLDPVLAGRLGGLAPGLYAYCGSAYGPGGLGARLARHLRSAKRPRWHIDRLTAAGRVVAVYAQPGGSECELLGALRTEPETSIPLPGFGSSDCRRCPAHLLRVPGSFEPPPLAGLLRLEIEGEKKGQSPFSWRYTAPPRRSRHQKRL
ncbi:MAG: GIY-YIG nuclease family protein [Kiloniellales bacterium]|nr:GIY-YIG nuclease family protein [Kiloniellales bacterium]